MKTFSKWLLENDEEPQLPQNNDKTNYFEPAIAKKDKDNLKTFIDEDGQWKINFISLQGYPEGGVATIYLTKDGAMKFFLLVIPMQQIIYLKYYFNYLKINQN